MKESAAPRAVVIGSGIGGSAATLLLAHAGIPTRLFEKNKRVGGSCSAYEKRGFQIDVGTHMFSRGDRGPLGDVLRRVESADAIKFLRTRDIAEVRAAQWLPPQNRPDRIQVAIPSSLMRMPLFAWRLIRALELSPAQVYRATRLFTYILAMSEEEVDAWNYRTLEAFLEPFDLDTKTLGMFALLLGLYFILPYWEISAGESLYCFRRMVRDNYLSYPKGGAIAIPGTYCRLAEERGAHITTRAGVRRILVKDQRVNGVELEDGTFVPASVIVSTSSIRTTVLQLVGAEHFPPWYVDQAKELRGSFIAVQGKLALKKKVVSAGCIVGGVGSIELTGLSSSDFKTSFDRFRVGQIPEVIPLYCPVPSNFDPDLAPPGCQLMTVCALAPTTDIPLTDSSEAWEDAMIRALQRVVPEIEPNLLFVDTFSTKFIENWIGKEYGPAVSAGQIPSQVGVNRPTIQTPIEGLYVAGCGAGGRGVGTELAADSAMECVDLILANLGWSTRYRKNERLTQLRRNAADLALTPLAWATKAR